MTEFNIYQFTDSTDSGSLRHAIIQANNSAEDDVINLVEGTYTLSLEGRKEDEAETGDLDITSGDVITIKGVGNDKTIIDAQQLDRVFDVLGESTLILEDLTITGGAALLRWEGGGGVRVKDGNLTLKNVHVFDNEALDNGGGVSIESGLLNKPTIEIVNSVISENETGGEGGGLHIEERDAISTITNISILNNSAGSGGGITNAGTLTMTNSLIKGNYADGGGGGGIKNANNLTLIDSRVTLNTAEASGGGIRNVHDTNAQAIVINTTVDQNKAGNNGGGIENASTGTTLSLINTTVSDNFARRSGGGVYNSGTTVGTIIFNSLITDNRALLNGGGITNSSSYENPIILENTIVYGNLDEGGGDEFNSIKHDVAGLIVGDAHNLVGDPTGASTPSTIGTGTDLVGEDPLLGTLQYNGGVIIGSSLDNGERGLTLTQKPAENSPVIDAGDNTNFMDLIEPLVDQRGFARFVDGDGNNTEIIDIGAVELSVSEGNQSDLTSFHPDGWDDAIVISTELDTNTDAVEITTEDSIYIDWAAINQNNVKTQNPFEVRAFVDGNLIGSWVVAPDDLEPNEAFPVTDIEYSRLPEGVHTVRVELDTLNQESESNEQNNIFEKNFTVVPEGIIDLTPSDPENWDGALVISTQPGNHTDAEVINTENTLYIDWAAINQLNTVTGNPFEIRLLLDGNPIQTWLIEPDNINYDLNQPFGEIDIELLPLPEGEHTISLKLDYFNQKPEDNEENNSVEKTFSVVPIVPSVQVLDVTTIVDENDGGDGGTGLSLRDAVDRANGYQGNTTINLEAKDYNLTLQGTGEDNTMTGDLDLTSGGIVTIKGAGRNQTIIDGGEIDRIFHVLEGTTLVLEDLTITGGDIKGSSNNEGGAVKVTNSNLTLKNVNVVENTAKGHGGAIYIKDGDLTITDSVISNNESEDEGGGIYIYDSPNSNTVTEATGTINNSIISSNKAVPSPGVGEGGGIRNRGGELTLTNTSVLNNSADRGGGIKNSGTLTVTDSLIKGNSALEYDGGGIENTGTATIIGSRIALNNAKSFGGGIENEEGTAYLINTTLDQNQTDKDGGGIHNYSSTARVLLVNATLSGNVAEDDGGGIAQGSGTNGIDIFNSTITNNRAVSTGGGIYNGDDATVAIIVKNTIISGNTDETEPIRNNIYGFIVGDAHNLVEDVEGAYGSIGTGTDLDLLGVDPLLTPLQDNGGAIIGSSLDNGESGSNLTHAPLPDSPVIDAGENSLIPSDSEDFDGDNNTSEPIPFDQRGVGFERIINGTVDLGAIEAHRSTFPTDEILNTPLNRFQNSNLPGTYLFATEQESIGIRQNFPNFIEEGRAFSVAIQPGDNLIRFNRFQNNLVPGTYLYASEGESESIRQNFPNFIEEGIAFYAYGADAGIGIDYYRMQNSEVQGTYIFVNEAEKNQIEANFPQFINEGVAFEVGV